jgi:hypothetical protein
MKSILLIFLTLIVFSCHKDNVVSYDCLKTINSYYNDGKLACSSAYYYKSGKIIEYDTSYYFPQLKMITNKFYYHYNNQNLLIGVESNNFKSSTIYDNKNRILIYSTFETNSSNKLITNIIKYEYKNNFLDKQINISNGDTSTLIYNYSDDKILETYTLNSNSNSRDTLFDYYYYSNNYLDSIIEVFKSAIVGRKVYDNQGKDLSYYQSAYYVGEEYYEDLEIRNYNTFGQLVFYSQKSYLNKLITTNYLRRYYYNGKNKISEYYEDYKNNVNDSTTYLYNNNSLDTITYFINGLKTSNYNYKYENTCK